MLTFRTRSASAITAAFLFSRLLCAAPALTTIQDVLYKADGSKFSGILQITWTSFQAADTSNIPTQNVTSEITNGYLHVLLVPTTNATPPAVYNVVYNSDGQVQFTETWVVPPSTTPLRVADVRTARGAGSAAALSQVQISDVSGLRTELNIRPTMGSGYAPLRAAVIDVNGGITGAMGGLSDCVHVDGSSSPCAGSAGGSSSFTDGETPSGTIDGSNTVFALATAPNPSTSLKLVRSGLVLRPGFDFTVSGATVTFQGGSVPQPGDALQVSYRTATSPSASFVDGETPSGTIDGVNATFTLSNTPNPATSLELYRNGMTISRGSDYSLSGATLTFMAGSIPQPGDYLQAYYRQ